AAEAREREAALARTREKEAEAAARTRAQEAAEEQEGEAAATIAVDRKPRPAAALTPAVAEPRRSINPAYVGGAAAIAATIVLAVWFATSAFSIQRPAPPPAPPRNLGAVAKSGDVVILLGATPISPANTPPRPGANAGDAGVRDAGVQPPGEPVPSEESPREPEARERAVAEARERDAAEARERAATAAREREAAEARERQAAEARQREAAALERAQQEQVERTAIAGLLAQYVAAYESMNEGRIRAIDPSFRSIPSRALLRGIDVETSNVSLRLSPDMQSADLTFTQSFIYQWARGGGAPVSSGTLTWRLQKTANGWQVAR
ncbi:MAG: hypothetical protein ABL986_14345, partial [Vicinamibacterales bacterium]